MVRVTEWKNGRGTSAIRRGSRTGWVALLLMALWIGSAASAQEPGGDKPASPTPAKKRTEPRGRLPAYYGDIVDSKQREQIYSIQAKHTAEIKKLREQIAEIEATLDNEVEAVLTPEQLVKVKQMQDEAKSRRTAASKRKRMDDEQP